MLLPCPHCRKQFRLLPEQIRSENATIQCPACEGLFRLNFTTEDQGVHAGPPRPRETLEESAPLDSRFRGNDGADVHGTDNEHLPLNDTQARDTQDTRASLGIYPKLARLARDNRSRPRFLMFWAVAPACFVFLALTGIFLPGHWLSSDDAGLSSSRAGITTEESHLSALHTPTSQAKNPIAQAFWSPTHSQAKDPCEVLCRFQQTLLETEDQDPCQLYPLWITYLILETAPKPACPVEPTFARAMAAVQGNTLCAPGYAFLSEYYLDRRLIERSQSFLDEALRLAPNDPWVKLVEAVFYEEAYYDDRKAIQILEELNREHPSSPLASYLLAKIYIRGEDYGKGNASFQSLKEDAKGQIAFWRIRRALSSLEKTGDLSEEKAESLLAMSRAFTTLEDFPMAEHLYRWVLRDMPDKLPKEEQTAAYCELGQLYETRGDRRSAYDAYRDALDIDPEFHDARERIGHLFPSQENQS